MLLQLSTRWPFVQRLHPARAEHTMHGVPAHAHRSWVKTPQGIGWIHHHEADGYVVELRAGGLAKFGTHQLTHLPPQE